MLAVVSLRAGIVSYLSAFDQLLNSAQHILDTQHLYEKPHEGNKTLCYKENFISLTLHQMSSQGFSMESFILSSGSPGK